MKFLDLTHTFTNGMPVYPGDPVPALDQISSINKAGFVDHQITTTMHVGTHMDAPAHMLAGGKYLTEYDASKFIGRGVLVDARGKEAIGIDSLLHCPIAKDDIVIILTSWSKYFGKPEYFEKFPELTLACAQKLVDAGAAMIGLDTPSPDRAPYEIHKLLLAHDVLIIENLTNLEALLPYINFEIFALPAKFHSEAAPCRVVAKIL